MPRKTNRNYRRKRRSRRKQKVPLGFPSSKLVRMKYAEQVTLNPSAGTIAIHDFCANGMFDPNLTGVGHQPYSYDNWMTVYNHYCVIGSKIKVRPVVTSTSNANPSYVTVGLFDSVTAAPSFSSVSHAIESGKLGKLRLHGHSAGMNTFQGTSTKTFSMKKFFRTTLNEDNIKGSMGANPAERAIFSVMAMSPGGIDSYPVTVLVEIEYLAVLSEPKLLSQS